MRTSAFILVAAVALGGATTAHAEGQPAFFVGSGDGIDANVKAFSDTATELTTINPFGQFRGGVRVAVGDINGDGTSDLIVGAGPGGGPHVKVFDGRGGALLHDFFPYPAGFTGGVFVAAGDVNGDGKADVVTGAGPGAGPHVRVFSGNDQAVLHDFFAFGPNFSGGVSVAIGDYGGDGVADVIVGAGPGGGPHVKVFDSATQTVKADFFAFDTRFDGGISVATGEFRGTDALFVGAGPGAGPHVKVFSLSDGRLLDAFDVFSPGFRGGVNVGFTRLEGRATLLVGMASEGGVVGLYDVGQREAAGPTPDILVASPTFLTPFGTAYMGGVSVAGVVAAPVPEPASWALMIAGFGLAGAAFRQRRGVAGARALG